MMKGDKITFIHPTTHNVTNGIVAKMGKRVKVVAIGQPEAFISGPAQAFMPADFQMPMADPFNSCMDCFEVRNYKDYPRLSEETTAMNCDIYCNGVKFATVENEGKGGNDNFKPVTLDKGRTYTDIQPLFAKAALWWEQCGGDRSYEPESAWLDWYVNERPYGVTARHHVQKYLRMLAS